MANIRTNDRTSLSAQFRRMADENTPEPLPQDAAQAVHAIIERAEAQYENAKG